MSFLSRIWSSLFPPQPPKLSREEQQRLGDEEWRQYEASLEGKTFMFGELHAAARRLQDKYPEWRMTPGGGPVSERPRQVERL